MGRGAHLVLSEPGILVDGGDAGVVAGGAGGVSGGKSGGAFFQVPGFPASLRDVDRW